MPPIGYSLKKENLEIFFDLLHFVYKVEIDNNLDTDAIYIHSATYLGFKNTKSFINQFVIPYNKMIENPEILKDKNFKYAKISTRVRARFIKKIEDIKMDNRAIDHPDYTPSLEKYKNLTNFFSQSLSNYEKSQEKKNFQSHQSFSEKDFISTFKNTIWNCYTRCQNENDPEIGKMIFSFTDSSKDCEINILIKHYAKKIGQWEGKARFIGADKLLVINVTRKHKELESTHYTHYLIRVESIGEDLKLCVGHMCFKHDELESIVSKPIIITKHIKGKKPVPCTYSFNDESIHPSIIKYFRKRELNRLATPGTMMVFDIETFGRWLTSTRSFNKKFEAIEGDYLIYFNFYPNQESPVENEIKIFDADLEGLSISFYYSIDNETPKCWSGSGKMNFETKLLSAHLKGPKKPDINDDITRNSNDKPIHLLIDLPPADTETVNTLCGIIGGYRDPERGSVARLFLMVKVDNDRKPENFDIGIVNNFFKCYSHRSWVRPPAQTSISKFEHVDLAIRNHMLKEYDSDLLKQSGALCKEYSIY